MPAPSSKRQQLYAMCLLFALSAAVVRGNPCPHGCRCGHNTTGEGSTMYTTNCSNAGMKHVPALIGNATQYLDLSNNLLAHIDEARLLHLSTALTVLDLRGNTHVHKIPLFQHFQNLSSIHVDLGATCCIFEMEWHNRVGEDEAEKAAEMCTATIPYHECDAHLIHMHSMVIYTIVFTLSMVLNPWVFVVTLATRSRRNDPLLLNSINFCLSNLLLTIYTGVILHRGILVYHEYHFAMASWLDNPLCGTVGYLLMTSTVASSFFYMVEILCLFLKVQYPFYPDHHIDLKKLAWISIAVWAFAFSISAVPFIVDGRYNRVGLCLPFYAGDFNFGFKFVLLYTAVINTAVLVNITLAIVFCRSVVKADRGQHPGGANAIPNVFLKQNKQIEKNITIHVCFYIISSMVNLTFLLMSCLGGEIGKTGREWFATICVIEAVTSPFLGQVRKKQFRKDTQKLLNKYTCLSADVRVFRGHRRSAVAAMEVSHHLDGTVAPPCSIQTHH